jgi:hypothetical protein
MNEAFRNLPDWEHQPCTVVGSVFNGEISQGDQERELVGRGEIALGKESLQLGQECELRFRARRRN